MYATNAYSHVCGPGDAAESLCMSLITIKGSQGQSRAVKVESPVRADQA